MKILLLTLISTLILLGCSSKPAKTTATTAPETSKKEKPAFDSTKPITYAQYKKWRKQNDPNSEAYAEYKQWEINLRQWKTDVER